MQTGGISMIFGSMMFGRQRRFRVLMFACAVLGAARAGGSVAWAQTGTGGTSGTTTTTLAAGDFFIAVQKQLNVNLTERNRSRFLNQSNCQCKTPVYLKAVILPSASIKANALPSSATVSMYLGSGCNQTTTIGCCRRLASAVYSDFKPRGLVVTTTVDQLMNLYSCSSSTGVVPGTGGTSGSGGSGGSGGAGGSDGSGGTTGTGGTGTGGSSGSTDVCERKSFGQSVWVFVGTQGEGSFDLGQGSLGFQVDTLPPDPPAITEPPAPANEALIVKWTALDTSKASDILGYQVLCTRADTTQVFKDGTFDAAFDSCPTAGQSTSIWPPSPRSSFVCSDLLPTSATSTRLKILENDIPYGVGVVAIDKQGNASVVSPRYAAPIATKDFYSDYRQGDPQGAATGGFCSLSGGGDETGSGRRIGAALASLALLGLACWRRSRRRK